MFSHHGIPPSCPKSHGWQAGRGDSRARPRPQPVPKCVRQGTKRPGKLRRCRASWSKPQRMGGGTMGSVANKYSRENRMNTGGKSILPWTNRKWRKKNGMKPGRMRIVERKHGWISPQFPGHPRTIIEAKNSWDCWLLATQTFCGLYPFILGGSSYLLGKLYFIYIYIPGFVRGISRFGLIHLEGYG